MTALHASDPWLPESTDDVLRWLILVIAISFVASILAAGAAIVLRLFHIIHEKRQANLEATWIPRILEMVVVPNSVDPSLPATGTMHRQIEALPPHAQRALLELIVRFAFVVTGAARTRLCTLAEPALPAARRLLHRRDPALRALGVHIVGHLGLDRNEYAVLQALSDPAPLVGMTAARALARAGRTDYIQPILSTASRLKHWGHSEVVSVLQDIGPAARPILRSAYADTNRSPAVRVVCAETLRWLNDLDAAGPAAEILRRSDDRELTAASLRLLRRIGAAEHAPAIRHLCTHHDPVIRLNAIAALAALGGQPDSGDTDRMGTALADPSSWVAIRAARGLKEMGESGPLRLALSTCHERANLAREIWPGLEANEPAPGSGPHTAAVS